MSTQLAIVFAPPGKRKETKVFLEKNLPNAVIHDIETKMITKFGLTDIKQLIGRHTRSFLKTEWEFTVKLILDSIQSDSVTKSKLNILLGHSMYYNPNTREFFPLFDPGFIKETISSNSYVSHVAFLIDDIYDSFSDLSKPGQLFTQRALSHFLQLFAKSTGTKYSDLQNNLATDSNWISHCINSLLNWRSKEMVLIQNIATQLDSKFMLWGIKQDLEVLCKWIQEPDKKIFYVSHPISEPRSGVKTSTDWPDLVHFINTIQTELKKNDLLVVMPTAIDEYRLSKDNKNYDTTLNLRWPVPTNVKSSLCDSSYSLIDDDYDKIEILHPKKIVITEDNVNRGDFIDVSSVQEYLNGIYSSLDMNIEYEIGNRDHLLVWSTEGIIVIEPYKINDNKISGGVKMELDYLQNVNSTIKESSENYSISDLRKLCAIFSIDTVMNILNDNSFKNKIIPRLRSIIVNQYNDLDFNTVENLINNSGNLIDDVTSLGTSVSENDVEDVRTNLENYKKEALVETFVGTALNMASTSLEYVMILFVEKLEDMNKEQNISLIKNFLIESKNYDWKDKLMEFAKDQKII